jgi:hypothetical protein
MDNAAFSSIYIFGIFSQALVRHFTKKLLDLKVTPQSPMKPSKTTG